MKKEVHEWIDKEVARLDREVEAKNAEAAEPDPVPDGLRKALAEIKDKKPAEQR